MTEKPDFVLSYQKPKNTEIKKIGNNWYVYERFSKYDPAIKRSRKVSGKCLGKLTPQGLVPTQRRLVKESDRRPTKVSDVAEAGAVLFFWDRTVSMRERLKEFFSDIWQTIYAAAILRAIKEPRFRRLQVHYETSLLAHLLPNLSFDAPSNAAFLQVLGRRREAICRFMQEDVNSNDVESIEVYNLSGQLVATSNGANSMDVSSLAAGNYIVRIFTPQGVQAQKLMKR